MTVKDVAYLPKDGMRWNHKKQCWQCIHCWKLDNLSDIVSCTKCGAIKRI